MIRVIFVMGVSGSGKSHIGKLLAEVLKYHFIEGDAYHPPSNKQKMASAKALNDADRIPWLQTLNSLAVEHQSSGVVIACSALKESYRKELMSSLSFSDCLWVFLHGSFELIRQRVKGRTHHFMPVALLQSQFDTLEQPQYGLTISVSTSPEDIIKTIKNSMMQKSQFGIMGLGVMGTSLSRNIAKKNIRLSLYNRHLEGKEEGVAQKRIQEYQELKAAQGFDNLKEFVSSIERPRKILMVLTAGPAIDEVIFELLPHLEADDILIDAGNSHFQDSSRREKTLLKHHIHFLAMGVSGGEKGALEGPSLMPGGSHKAYSQVEDILSLLAAKSFNGLPCSRFIGKGGSGHFVKTIHNGIEYAEMQLIAEVYQFLQQGLAYNNEQIADCFASWCATESNSYLLQISSAILRQKEGQNYLLDLIMDKASHKGTGSWATIAGAELGVSVSMMAMALNARQISALKLEREAMNKIYKSQYDPKHIAVSEIKKAYDFARLLNHHQGFELLRAASKEYAWQLNLSEIAQTWTGGCIIKSTLMNNLVEVLSKTERILMHPDIITQTRISSEALKSFIMVSVESNIPSACFMEGYLYFRLMNQVRSSANMIQAQRDYFGAHQYQKSNDSSNQWYHTRWSVFKDDL